MKAPNLLRQFLYSDKACFYEKTTKEKKLFMKKKYMSVASITLLAFFTFALTGLQPLWSQESGGHGEESSSIETSSSAKTIPKPFSYYQDKEQTSLWKIIKERAQKEPFNVAATLIFVLAILHTFVATKFTALANRLDQRHRYRLSKRPKSAKPKYAGDVVEEVHFGANLAHFLGDVEAVFGLWALVLSGVIVYFFNWDTMIYYISEKVNYTEPLFVVTIMALAASRPILRFAENSMAIVSSLGKKTPAMWWFTILTIGPLLGSFITEPAAMTISALLLSRQFYDLKPSSRFSYATLGLLFVNVSVGGTLSHFAAPPVLMVAHKWGWGLSHMFINFGWKAVIGILINNVIYLLVFSKEFKNLRKKTTNQSIIHWDNRPDPVPLWITSFHILFMAWTVLNAHHPTLFIGGFLFFLGFSKATIHHQNRSSLRNPLMVGFFLSGLVIHGGLQGWWLAPLLGHLSEVPLMIGSTILTSFNDNAAITYLSSMVPNLSASMKYAVMAGAVTGGGLTVIANAPNPAGQSILSHYFGNGIAPLYLVASAIVPTVVVGLSFMLL